MLTTPDGAVQAPDARLLGDFIRAVFKHALPGNVISLRAFPQSRNERPIFIRPFEIENDGLDDIVFGAIAGARDAARSSAVFSPPVATFKNIKNASTANLAEGLVLSVECDERPRQALQALTKILGAPTLVVASGGVWLNPKTGEFEDKLHLYWRLAVPVRDAAGFAKLKEALKLATGIVGADATNTSIVHPLRWPGSWHLKAEPRLCRIVEHTDTEIDLDKALKLLRAAAPVELQRSAAHQANATKLRPVSSSVTDQWSLQGPVDIVKIECAVMAIPNNDATTWHDWKSVMCLRIYAATRGSAEGFVIFDAWSRLNEDKYDEANTKWAWQEAARSEPDHTGAEAIYAHAREHGRQAKPTITKPAPNSPTIDRKTLPTFEEGVEKTRAKIRYFLDNIVIGKEKRNVYNEYAVKTKLGMRPALEPPDREDGESDEAFEARQKEAQHPSWPRAVPIIGIPGLHKSSIAREETAERIKAGLIDKKVVVMLQRLDFAAEHQAKFAELGIRAGILRGRTDKDSEHGPANCHAMEKVRLAEYIGTKVADFVCKTCAFKNDCLYMATMQEEPPVWIGACNYLFLEQDVLKDAAFVLIDEGFISRGITDDIERYSVAFHDEDTQAQDVRFNLRNLIEVLADQKNSGGVEQGAVIKSFTGLAEGAGMLKPGQRVILTNELKDAEKTERDRLSKDLLPELKELMDAPGSKARRVMQSSIVEKIQHTQTFIRVLYELRHFVDRWSRDRGDGAPIQSGRVLIEKFGGDDDASKLLIWRGISRITKQFQVPILLLDVEFERKIIEAFIPQIESPVIIDVALPETSQNIQIFGAPTSSTKIGDAKKRKHESDQAFAERCKAIEENRQAVLAFIIEKWRKHGSPDTVVICQQAFENWVKRKLPSGIEINHYGNIAGTNNYENKNLKFLVGRSLPGPAAVESLASTISGLQVESIVSKNREKFDWYLQTADKIEMRDGSTVVGRGHAHPDALCQAFIRSILSELLQAFGRTRPWGRKTPQTSYLMLDERVPRVVLDAAEAWPQPDPFAAQIAEGILLKSKTDLMQLWPETFTCLSTTKRYIKTHFKLLKVPDGCRRFTYRVAGRRGPTAAGWFDPERLGDLKSWLEKRFGGAVDLQEDF